MYSLTVKPSFVPKLSVAASSSSCPWPPLCFTAGLPVKTKSRVRRFGLKLRAYDSSKSETPNANGDSKPPNGSLVGVSLFLFLLFFVIAYLICFISII